MLVVLAAQQLFLGGLYLKAAAVTVDARQRIHTEPLGRVIIDIDHKRQQRCGPPLLAQPLVDAEYRNDAQFLAVGQNGAVHDLAAQTNNSHSCRATPEKRLWREESLVGFRHAEGRAVHPQPVFHTRLHSDGPQRNRLVAIVREIRAFHGRLQLRKLPDQYRMHGFKIKFLFQAKTPLHLALNRDNAQKARTRQAKIGRGGGIRRDDVVGAQRGVGVKKAAQAELLRLGRSGDCDK